MLIESLRKNSGKINFDVSIDPLENVAISEFVSSFKYSMRTARENWA